RPAPIQFIAPSMQKSGEAAPEAMLAAVAGAEELYPSKLSFDAPISNTWSRISAERRIIGSRFSSNRVRGRFDGSYDQLPAISLELTDGSIPGNGLGAFNARGVNITVHGGAEDGVGKMAFG